MSGCRELPEDPTWYEFVNEKLWLLTERPNGWRGSVAELERRYCRGGGE